MFVPLTTDRLRLRPVQPGDAEALAARRNDPEVAELQSWATPVTLEQAEAIIADVAAHPEPPIDRWWMLTIERRDDGAILGDLALHLTWDGRGAEIGYTLGREAWGHGYATEAAGALVDHLFDQPRITRVSATLHPDNERSARVIENLGFLFEGRTKLSYWVEDDNTDDLLYGLTRADLDAWRARPSGAPERVELVEVTHENVFDVIRLVSHKSQERYVTPNVVSFAEALHPEPWEGVEVVPWYRAIVADGLLAGFVMLDQPTEDGPEPYLWRLLIDRRHQRRGIGRRALDLVVEQCRDWGVDSLVVSWSEGVGGPRPFYERYGFVTTGNLMDGETEARLDLSTS